MHGYIRVCAASPKLIVADCKYNSNEIIKIIKDAFSKDIKIIVFPELCITGYTCGDLFFQSTILEDAEKYLLIILEETKNLDILIVVSMPIKTYNQLFNCAVIIHKGKIKGIVPKTYLPNNNEFMEKRWFCPAKDLVEKEILFCKQFVPIGADLLFSCSNIKDLLIGVEICQDIWAPIPPSSYQALNGANLILNLSASNEINNKYEKRRGLVSYHSSKIKSGYVYCSCNFYESSSDVVFSGHNIICENGEVIEESDLFKKDSHFIFNDIDIDMINKIRITGNNSYYESRDLSKKFRIIDVDIINSDFKLKRRISKYPFLPNKNSSYNLQYENIFNIQMTGLAKRILHINVKKIILGISGGIDSTLSLLCAAKTYDFLNIDRSLIVCVTMPGFGTTEKTYKNVLKLAKSLHVTLKEIDIKNSCLKHFEDINQDPNNYDVVFENSQARERMQILMDIANMENGVVLGTSDLSEIALGFTTYNGDHMSMYNVNVSIPKTLAKDLLQWFLDIDKFNEETKTIIKDIINIPISPELIPNKNNYKQEQLTENILGSYVLNDFYLYYVVNFGFSPSKIIFLAQEVFGNIYNKEELISSLKNFYRRFFTNQFKRSCMPDGPKATDISLSPRGDYKMISDASCNLWIEELDNMMIEEIKK